MKHIMIAAMFASVITFVFVRYMERRQADEYINKLHREMIYGGRP